MNALELFQQYRTDRRGCACPGYALEAFPDLCRYTAETVGHEGFVSFAELDPATASERIEAQIRHFERLGQPFEWKVYDLEQPASLKSLLEAHGFVGGEAEAFLVAVVDEWPETALDRTGAPLTRITDRQGLRDFIAVEEAAFGEAFPTHLERYLRELEPAPDTMAFYCAYQGGQPVAAGRMSLPAQSNFAGLWSGCVVPAMRRRGLYSALLNGRIGEARARGYRFVTVDAEPTSRPILLRKGFQHVCWTYPMRRQKS